MIGDFDFLPGVWDVANRRLLRRHVGSDEWDAFPGLMRAQSFFDGAGSFDETVFPTKGFRGVSLRTFDPVRREWSIYWVNSSNGLLALPPVVGGFADGVGTFYSDDVDEGRPIRCRYTWSRITPTSCRWDQAFSLDGEKTWETNWIMDLTRRKDG